MHRPGWTAHAPVGPPTPRWTAVPGGYAGPTGEQGSNGGTAVQLTGSTATHRHPSTYTTGPRPPQSVPGRASASVLGGATPELLLRQGPLDRARGHIEGIRSGLADVSPARTRKFDPCAWCSWRPACLRDESIDARACREFKTVKASELVDAIRKRMKE